MLTHDIIDLSVLGSELIVGLSIDIAAPTWMSHFQRMNYGFWFIIPGLPPHTPTPTPSPHRSGDVRLHGCSLAHRFPAADARAGFGVILLWKKPNASRLAYTGGGWWQVDSVALDAACCSCRDVQGTETRPVTRRVGTRYFRCLAKLWYRECS